MSRERGTVVKGPDLFADNDFGPYLRVSDDTHPFADEEGRLTEEATETIARATAGYLRVR